MKLTRGKRIALELLGPPALGAGIYTLLFAAGMNSWDVVILQKGNSEPNELVLTALLFLTFAYVLVGIQGIIYTVILEWRFKHGLGPHSWRMVGLSSGLGFASGAILLVLALPRISFLEVRFSLIMGGLGAVVGFLLGLLIKRWSTGKETMGKIHRE